MKQFSKQLHKKATSTVTLQAAEKRELKERVVAYMEYHPLPAELKSTTKQTSQQLSSAPFTTVSIPFAKLFKFASAAAVFVLIVMPFMAERAVPGDALYAVKVQFNEEVRGSLTFDTYQKVEWETERLNRRIAEARLLASEGRLTEEMEAEVADAVRVHTANAQREIAELRVEDADAATIASIAFDTTLEVQSTSLKGEDDAAIALATSTENVRHANLIADAIDKSRSEAEGVKASSTLPSFEKLVARVEQNTTRVYELLTALQTIAPSDEFAEVTRRVEDIDRAILESTKAEDMNATSSRQSLVDVLQRSQRLIVYMTELMVIKTVDIETLIPVVLTEAEEAAIIDSLNQEISQKTAQVKQLLLSIEDAENTEKVEFALAAVEVQTGFMASSTETFTTFNMYAAEAIALLDDSLRLLEKKPSQVIIDTEDSSEVATSTATSSVAEIIVDTPEDAVSTSTQKSDESTVSVPVDAEQAQASTSSTSDSGVQQ